MKVLGGNNDLQNCAVGMYSLLCLCAALTDQVTLMLFQSLEEGNMARRMKT